MTKGARQADGTLHGNSEEGALARQGRDRERGHGQVGRRVAEAPGEVWDSLSTPALVNSQ